MLAIFLSFLKPKETKKARPLKMITKEITEEFNKREF